MKPKEGRVYSFFFRFWWTILIVLFCYGFYLHGMHKKREQFTSLKTMCDLLENKLSLAMETREDLGLQIASQSDPSWAELVIKKRLGMVPSGQTKVYFEQQ